MKRSVFLFITVLTALALSCCGHKNDTLKPSEIGSVVASDALYSSYLYQVSDPDAVAELAAIYNSVTYEPLKKGEEMPDDLLTDKLYMLTYYRVGSGTDDDIAASLWISPRGYVFPDVGENRFENACRLTSSFDEQRLRMILTEYGMDDDVL